MTELSPKSKGTVVELVRDHIFEPLGQLFIRFNSDLRIQEEPDLLVSTIANLFFSIHTNARMGQMKAKDLVAFNVDLFFKRRL